MAALPLKVSPGDNVASSSIWNIKSLIDCLDLSTGLLATFGISFADVPFALGVVEGFSELVCRCLVSCVSSRFIRDCSFIESI